MINPGQVENRLEEELEDGETLLWFGFPEPRRAARTTLPIFLFAIPWTLFSFFWVGAAAWGMWGESGDGTPLFMKVLFPLFGIPFALLGLWMLSAPWSAYRKAMETVYAVTNGRIFIMTLGQRRTVKSYRDIDPSRVVRTEFDNGRGDLVFAGPAFVGGSAGRAVGLTAGFGPGANDIGFYGIENARQVERLILDNLCVDQG